MESGVKTLPTEYESRLKEVNRKLSTLPRGAKMTASYDLRLAPSMISQVLLGNMYRIDILAMLEDWLSQISVEDIANRKNPVGQDVQLVSTFITACIESDPNGTLNIKELFSVYKGWVTSQGYSNIPINRFTSIVRQTYPLVTMPNGERVFAGIKVEDAAE